MDVNPEDVKLQAFLEAEVEKLNAELEAARMRIAELEAQLEQAASPAVEAAETQERYQAGGEAAADAEVVAIKSKHGHAFWRSGYHVQPYFTFVKRADFEPEAWERLLAEPWLLFVKPCLWSRINGYARLPIWWRVIPSRRLQV